jgi:hypothetical protein
MISVADPQFDHLSFPPDQAADSRTYNNVSIIWIEGGGGGVAIVDLGVDALDCDFSVASMNNSGNKMSENFLAGPGSNTTTVVDPAGRELYKLGALLISGGIAGPGASPPGTIVTQSNIQTHPNLAVGVVVYNINKNSWSYITAFTAPNAANITLVEGPAGNDAGDALEFHAAPTMSGTWFPALGQGRGVSAYNYAAPDRFDIAPAVPGLGPGVMCMYQGGDIGSTYDLEHPAVCVISPPPSVYHSGISTRLQVKTASDWRLEYILRWKT